MDFSYRLYLLTQVEFGNLEIWASKYEFPQKKGGKVPKDFASSL